MKLLIFGKNYIFIETSTSTQHNSYQMAERPQLFLFSLELQVSKLYVGIITSQAHIALDFQKRFQCSLNVCIGMASV